MHANMSVENEDFYDEDEEVVEEDLNQDEDNSMEIFLDEKPDVKTLKVPPGPPSSAYSPSEENILIKLKLGNCSMEEVETYKEELQREQWIQSEDLPKGWLYKKFGSDLKLLGRGGELFEDMNEAFEFVEKYQAYFSQEDMMKIFVFGEGKSSHNEDTKTEAIEEDIKAEEVEPMEDGKTEVDPNLGVWVSNDPSVPKGWKIRKSKMGWNVIQSQVLSPDNKHFSGRRAALKFMIENNFLKGEIDAMRKCLRHDGWMEDQTLPKNWFYKPDFRGNNNYFLDDRGNFYRYSLEVFKKNDDKTIEESLKTFLTAQKKIYNYGKDLDEDWSHDDPTVPKGWMIRKVPGKVKNRYHLLSPDRQHFTSRRNALKFMMENNYPEDEVIFMRKSMKYDGWQENTSLPLNWFYKEDRENNGKHIFLDAEGNFYSSQLKVLKSITSNEVKSAIKAFSDASRPSYNVNEDNAESWSSNDTTVPPGWLIRKLNGASRNVYHVLSPDKHHFPGRRSALKFLIEKKYPETEIQGMRDCLQFDNWLQSPALPRNWFYKPSNKSGTARFLAEDATLYKSMTDVMKEVKNRKFETNFQQFLSANKPVYNNDQPIDESWRKDDPTVPSGWMIRKVGGENLKNSYHLLSPEKQHFAGRRKALQYLIQKHYPEEAIEEMRKCLKHDGWVEDPKLPSNWFYKSRNEGGYHFLDARGNVYESKDAAIRGCSQEQDIVGAIKNFLGSQTPVYNKGKEIDSSWIFNDPRAPKGWAIRERNNGSSKQVYQLLSPERRFLSGFKSALIYLIETQQPKEDIEEVRKLMEIDGWHLNPSLPENWLFKFRGRPDSLSYCFIRAEGQFFRSKEAALKYLQENNLTDEKEKVAAFAWRPENRPLRTMGEDYKKDDPTVPAGWLVKKVKKLGSSYTSSLLFSPEGDTFQGRRPALKFLIEKKYPEEKIEEMRELIKFEGFNFDSRLPEKWLYKSSTKHSAFIDSFGNYHRSKFEAIKMLKTKGQSQDLNLLMCFSEKKQETNESYLTEKLADDTWIKDDPSVPAGWMMKVVQFGQNNVTKLISPRGQLIQGRRLALKMMIKENFSKEEISEMRSCLKVEGWSEHESLPKDWLHRTTKDGTSFINADGDLFRKKVNALKYLQEKGTVESMESFKTLNSFQTEESSSPVKRSPKKKKNILHEDWKEFNLEPLLGWKYKEDPAGHGNKRYLSPSGFYLNGKSHVIKFLLENKYSEDAISAMRGTFKTDGWQIDSSLPEAWLWKKTGKNMMFLSPGGSQFKSKVEAITYMKSHMDSPGEIELLSNFLRAPGK